MCVLLDGSIQQERENGTVEIPFGSEYSLRFRNKHNRRAVVKIYIDGENVSDGGYVIPAGGKIDIMRHIEFDRSFKFVELNSEEAIEQGKNGSNADKVKGTIEARFHLEKPQVYYSHPIHRIARSGYRSTMIGGAASASCGNNSNYLGRSTKTCSLPDDMQQSTMDCCLSFNSDTGKEQLKDGCTVEGSSTGQSFCTTTLDIESEYTSLKLFLQGYAENNIVHKNHSKDKKSNQKIEDLKAERDELEALKIKLENDKLKKEIEDLKTASKESPKKPPKKRAAKKISN